MRYFMQYIKCDENSAIHKIQTISHDVMTISEL